MKVGFDLGQIFANITLMLTNFNPSIMAKKKEKKKDKAKKDKDKKGKKKKKK